METEPKMHEVEKSLSPEEQRVAQFQQEMAEKKQQEAEKEARGEVFDSHFPDMNPEELTELEADIYEKYKDGTLTFDEYNAARNEANMSLPKDKIGHEDSRVLFYAHLGNKVNGNKQWRKKWGLG